MCPKNIFLMKATYVHDSKKEGAREAVYEVTSKDPPNPREMKLLLGKQM